jgi:CheY-like chemotaxis protein
VSETAKILLVDDEPAMLRYIRTLLEVDDYKVKAKPRSEAKSKKLPTTYSSSPPALRCARFARKPRW